MTDGHLPGSTVRTGEDNRDFDRRERSATCAMLTHDRCFAATPVHARSHYALSAMTGSMIPSVETTRLAKRIGVPAGNRQDPAEVAVLLNDAKAALLSDRAFARTCVARALDLLHEDLAPVSGPSELCRSGGAPFVPPKGGLAPWAERRCLELIRARLSEDVSLDELAAEAQLSPFHFARMFKQSVGVPPRVYLTRLRVEKACDLLEHTDLPITEIALEVGYSSNQVLARVFLKHQRMSPSDYRRAVRDPVRSSVQQ
jgi:AraC-like DNA-binding protein